MPFTLAHPAAIVYFKNKFRNLSTTGLVVGSMGPDLGYYAHFRIAGHIEHSWLMSCFVVVPYTILFSLLFHCFVKPCLFQNLPKYFKSRLKNFDNFNFINHLKRNFGYFVTSAIIGIYTHLLWDSFTHSEGFFVEQIAGLNYELLGVAIYKWLQYGGSIIGMLVLVKYFHFLEKVSCETSKLDLNYFALILFFSVLMVFIRFYFFPIPIKIGNLLVVPISSIFVSLCIAGYLNPVLAKQRLAK